MKSLILNKAFSTDEVKMHLDTLYKVIKSKFEEPYRSADLESCEKPRSIRKFLQKDTLDEKLAKFKMAFPKDCFAHVLKFNDFPIDKELLLACAFSDIGFLNKIDFKSKDLDLKALNTKTFVKYLLKIKPRQAEKLIHVLIGNGLISEKLTCRKTKESLVEIFKDVSPFIDLDLEKFVTISLKSFQFVDFLNMPQPENDISTTLPVTPETTKIKMNDLTSFYEEACKKVGALYSDSIKEMLNLYVKKIKEKSIAGLAVEKKDAYKRLENNLCTVLYALKNVLNDELVDLAIRKKKCDEVFFVIKEIAPMCVSPFQKDLVEVAIKELRNYLPIDEEFKKLVTLLEDPKKILVREVKKIVGECALNKAKFLFLVHIATKNKPRGIEEHTINNQETAFLDWFRKKVFKIPFSSLLREEDMYSQMHTVSNDVQPTYLKMFKKEFHPLAVLEMLQNHFEELGIFYNRDESELFDWQRIFETYIKNHWPGIPGKDYWECAKQELLMSLMITEKNKLRSKLIEKKKNKIPLRQGASVSEKLKHYNSICTQVDKDLERFRAKYEKKFRDKAEEDLIKRPLGEFEINEKIKSLKYSDGICTIYKDKGSDIPEKVGLSRFVIHNLLKDAGIAS